MWRCGRNARRFGLILALGVVFALLGGVYAFEPSAQRLAEAMRALGPISGWRCVQNAIYAYDPRTATADATLLSEAPERFLAHAAPNLVVERVEVDLRAGETVVWARLVARDEPTADPGRRVYVLSPGRLQWIGIDGDSGWSSICTSHLGEWQIVAEHTLE